MSGPNPPPGSVVVWERDGLWEARLDRELRAVARVHAARTAADAAARLRPPAALVIVADTAADWLDRPPAEAAAVVLVADHAEAPLWLAAGVSAVFPSDTSAARVAASVRRGLGLRPRSPLAGL